MLIQLLRRFQPFEGLAQMSNESLDDLAQITADNFRSMGSSREDSLVFIMGLLNLGTILCYTIYNQLFGKSGSTKTWPLNEEYLSKKIQSILDELVLHVHTTSYYRTAHQVESEARGFASNRPIQVSQRRSLYTGHGFLNIPEPIFEERSAHLPVDAGLGYDARHREGARINSDAEFNFYLIKEVRKLMAEWFSMLEATRPSVRTKRQIFSTSSTYPPHVWNGTHVHRRFQNANRMRRRRPLTANGTGLRRRWYSASRKVGFPLTEGFPENQSGPDSKLDAHFRTGNGTVASTSHAAAPNGSTVTNRQLGPKKANIPLLSLGNRPLRFGPTTTTTTTTSSTSTTTEVPDVIAATMTKSSSHVAETEPESDIPMDSGSHILPVESLFPHQKTDTVRPRTYSDDFEDDHGASYVHPNHRPETPRSRPRSEGVPVRDRWPVPKQMRNQEVRPPYGQAHQAPYQAVHNEDEHLNEASWTNGQSPDADATGQNGLIANLMQLVMQTTPLALDVLNVYKRQPSPSKCMESLLCQVNQDWKKKGSVPAAMAPFMSISLGWLQEDSDRPSLSQVLMAVRAGWIGKNCAALYPRCSHPIERPTWTVSQVNVPSDSVHMPSITSPTFKVKPPTEFSSTPRPTTKPPPTTTKPVAVPTTSTTMRALRAGPDRSSQPAETVNHKPTTNQEESVTPNSADSDDWAEEDEAVPASWSKPNGGDSKVVGTSLQVGNNKPGQVSVDRISDKTQRPWGKPSRLSSPGELSLSDIVRGVYHPTAQGQPEEPEERDDTDDEEEEEEEEDDEEEDEDDIYSNETGDDVSEEETTAGILHDLKANHFADKKKPHHSPYPNTRNIPQLTVDDPQMRPRLQLGSNSPTDQWLSPSAWVNSQSAANIQLPWRHVGGNDANYLRSDEDLFDDRSRDRVSTSFTHEDAVKDVRLHEVVMQYLRDRSA